jgi:heme/copper-type cytochrome/quinol oxidase subunit 3
MDESTKVGDHTIAVQMGITSGFILFIVSEIMLFFGFF